MENELLNHWKRLERVGNPRSYSNQKLCLAATKIAKAIAQAFAYDGRIRLEVSGDFYVRYLGNGSNFQLYATENRHGDSTTFYDSQWGSRCQSLGVAREFAGVIADGLLIAIAQRVRDLYGDEASTNFKNSIGMRSD